jgi:hypothetical protein
MTWFWVALHIHASVERVVLEKSIAELKQKLQEVEGEPDEPHLTTTRDEADLSSEYDAWHKRVIAASSGETLHSSDRLKLSDVATAERRTLWDHLLESSPHVERSRRPDREA